MEEIKIYFCVSRPELYVRPSGQQPGSVPLDAHSLQPQHPSEEVRLELLPPGQAAPETGGEEGDEDSAVQSLPSDPAERPGKSPGARTENAWSLTQPLSYI